MSAKRSFDVKTKRGAKVLKAPPVRRAVSGRPKPLKARRREKTQKGGAVVAVAVVCVVAGLVYLLWRPEVRITHVEAGDISSLATIAQEQLSGTYHGILPRNSFFFYPEEEIRAAVLEAHPDISSLSVSRTGFTTITLSTSARTLAFLWCGTPGAEHEECFKADAQGFVFAPYVVEGTSTPSELRVYAELDSSDGPIRSHVVGFERIPEILNFSRAVEALGVPVEAIAIRGDEADLIASSGTRITYVIGKEEEAIAGAQISFPKLNLMDGSIEYVDLRFNGKVYYKRTGESS